MLNSEITLENLSQLEEIDRESKKGVVLIFKHSTRCPISKRVLEQFRESVDKEVKVYHLDLLSHRRVSDAIANRYGIPHQSPQLLAIKGEKVVYHASHSDIVTDPPKI